MNRIDQSTQIPALHPLTSADHFLSETDRRVCLTDILQIFEFLLQLRMYRKDISRSQFPALGKLDEYLLTDADFIIEAAVGIQLICVIAFVINNKVYVFQAFTYSRKISCSAHALTISSGQTETCTSPICALRRKYIHSRLCPMPPPIV